MKLIYIIGNIGEVCNTTSLLQAFILEYFLLEIFVWSANKIRNVPDGPYVQFGYQWCIVFVFAKNKSTELVLNWVLFKKYLSFDFSSYKVIIV